MTIRQVMHSGPAKANELFARLAETSDGAVKTRERLLAELRAELEVLAGLEETHLFPVLRKHEETKALVADALADNKQVRALLAEIEQMPKKGQEFPGKLAELRKVFQQHVRDEKRELLPAVAKALSEEEAQTVAEKIEAGKAEAAEAKRQEAERQRAAEAKRQEAERQRVEAEEAKRQEAERQRAEAAEAKRQEAERQRVEAEEAKRQEAERQRAEAAEAKRQEVERQRAEAAEAKRQEAERQRAAAKREREEAAAEQVRREEAERRRAEARREREEGARREAAAAERRARETAEAVTRPVEVVTQGGLRAVEAGGAAAEAGAEIATRGSRQAADAASQVVQRTAASALGATRRYHAAASQVLKAEGDLAGFWLELVREQAIHNFDTIGRLAATRDWREAVELQRTLVRLSLERMSRLSGRYLETVQAVLTVTGSADGTDKAA